MQITGKNLKLVSEALGLALIEVHNMIATCPDVNLYADELEEYDHQHERITKLKERVDASLRREGLSDDPV